MFAYHLQISNQIILWLLHLSRLKSMKFDLVQLRIEFHIWALLQLLLLLEFRWRNHLCYRSIACALTLRLCEKYQVYKYTTVMLLPLWFQIKRIASSIKTRDICDSFIIIFTRRDHFLNCKFDIDFFFHFFFVLHSLHFPSSKLPFEMSVRTSSSNWIIKISLRSHCVYSD